MAEQFDIVIAVQGDHYGHRAGTWAEVEGNSFESLQEAIDVLEKITDGTAPGFDNGIYAVQLAGERWPAAGSIVYRRSL